MIYLIVAVSNNHVIGRNNGLPWRIPLDMKWFKMNTIGSTIGMGRKTWESMGRPLPNRHHIVLSRTNLDHAWKSVEQCYSMRHFRERMRSVLKDKHTEMLNTTLVKNIIKY